MLKVRKPNVHAKAAYLYPKPQSQMNCNRTKFIVLTKTSFSRKITQNKTALKSSSQLFKGNSLQANKKIRNLKVSSIAAKLSQSFGSNTFTSND